MKTRWLALVALVLAAVAGRTQSFTNLYNFSAYNPSSVTNSDGANPRDGLVVAGGVLYGTTQNGGLNGEGTVFALPTTGNGFTNLHSFASTTGLNSDGARPTGRLLLSGSTLYGTAPNGGTNGNGVVFSLLTNGTDFVTLFAFPPSLLDTGVGAATNDDGILPHAGLSLYNDVLYGTAINGGLGGWGTVFGLGTNGANFDNLHGFNDSDGGNPIAGVALSGTNLYGATIVGGNGFGALFAVGTNGTGFTNIYMFNGSDGYYPYGDLLVYSNHLYGTTVYGGKNGAGTIFRIGLSGAGYTNLYNFSSPSANNQGTSTNADGFNPYAGLTLVGNLLYGVTTSGGLFGEGTVFAASLDGLTFFNLHNFTAVGGASNANSDGANPYGALVYANGVLYDTTQNGGTHGNGAIFGLTLPAPALNIQLSGTNVILSWSTPGYSLQAATNVTGIYTNLPGATSPHTNAASSSQLFFRLESD